MDHTAVFLEFSANKLVQLMGRIRESAGKLSEEQVWMRGSENENAVGNLLLHLSGNVRQWVIAKVGGKPDVRVRDREFSARGDIARDELVERLGATVEEAVAVIRSLTAERLMERVQIQKYDVTVLEAIYHVVEHFAEHTGQIVFATKLFTGSDLAFYKHLTSQAPRTDATP